MDDVLIQHITNDVDAYIKKRLPTPRLEHSVRVAQMAQTLCERFLVNPEYGFLAGLAHDMCKVEKDSFLLEHALCDASPISHVEYNKPSLLHGRVAAVLLKKDYGVNNSSILEAVKHHTLGSPDLDDLGKIIFVADKIELGRKDVLPAFRQSVLEADLNTMMKLIIENNIAYLKRRGKVVSPISELTLIRLNQEEDNEKRL